LKAKELVLLVRPISPNERFGLGPFFRVEPLGLEYVAATLRSAGYEVALIDERFAPSIEKVLRQLRPSFVGISCMHTVDIGTTLNLARKIKRVEPTLPVFVGGHVVALYQEPFFDATIDALALGDAETTLIPFLRYWFEGRKGSVPIGFWVRREPGDGATHFEMGQAFEFDSDMNRIALPARDLVEPYRKHYLCVHKQPLWALETARGCPFRCSFCSTSLRNGRKCHTRDLSLVAEDFATVGKNVFVVDDLFFYPQNRSLELANLLKRRGIRKDWLLVQTRLDTVARHPEVLEAWRGLSNHFDLFFGFEAPTNAQLSSLSKDMNVQAAEEGISVARHYGFGVTGNFVIDPDWGKEEFSALWEMVDRLKLSRLGYTVLTPLPGTPLFTKMQHRIVERDFAKWDMHHLLYEPRLGREQFFELFVECWRRNVLSSRRAAPKILGWMRGLTPGQILTLVRVLLRTQRMLNIQNYLDETFPLQVPATLAEPQRPV
jgi:radical SAM superfamily enzyme YgiQ (UPF0313 family)